MTTTRGTQWEFFEVLTAGLYLKKKKKETVLTLGCRSSDV